jgi:hypothetical protein
MTIRVLSVEYSSWNTDNNQALLLGEFSDENEALTEIWRDLVQKKQHRAYLLCRRHRWIKSWRKPVSIVWGRLQDGLPKIYQEALDANSKPEDMLRNFHEFNA